MTGFALPDIQSIGAEIMARAETLGAISEGGPGVTRLTCTPEHRRAFEVIQDWMAEAGMTFHVDAVGNLVGRYEGAEAGAPALMSGSHQDTVRQGGKYDGMLGFLVPLSGVGVLNKAGVRFPFAIEIPIFSDEEGVRYGTSLFGSKALAGTFDMAELERIDANGITLRQALVDFGCDPDAIPAIARRPDEVLAFLEVHIEQGPVLEAEGLPIGVVDAFAGGDRIRVTVTGEAGHAGTVPMGRRKDALTAASEMVLAVEEMAAADGLVGTVGWLEAKPGAINVIPGSVAFTIDLRGPDDEERRRVRGLLLKRLSEIAARRGVSAEMENIYEILAQRCTPWMVRQAEAAVRAEGVEPLTLYSGAGHDAMAMADLTAIAMLFVRCLRGVSHNPAESITTEDAGTAARTWLRFVQDFRPEPINAR